MKGDSFLNEVYEREFAEHDRTVKRMQMGVLAFIGCFSLVALVVAVLLAIGLARMMFA